MGAKLLHLAEKLGFCVDYTPFCLVKGRNMRRFYERQRLVSQTKHKKFNAKYRTMTIAYYQSG